MYRSMSFPCDVHIHQPYTFALGLSKTLYECFCFIYSAYAKNLACNKNEIKTYIRLDCFAMAEQNENGINNQLSTVASLFVQILPKRGQETFCITNLNVQYNNKKKGRNFNSVTIFLSLIHI